jgi:NAD(P)-dependent dehydrogenase (short-subunit alcohol dehydrogenase family)
MSGRLEGKVAVITGGGNGIGRATALRFLAEGARVVIADLNPTSGEETLALARQAGAGERIRFLPADVTREADVAAAVQAGPDAFGRLDCVFNNAGIAGAFGPITHVDADELAPQRIRANAICPGLILTPLVHRGAEAAMEPIAARMQPWPEAGRPEHIAAVALFLASDEARFVTGEALVADGGLTAAGGNAAEKLGMGGAMYAAAGMDRGSTGAAPTLRTLE